MFAVFTTYRSSDESPVAVAIDLDKVVLVEDFEDYRTVQMIDGSRINTIAELEDVEEKLNGKA